MRGRRSMWDGGLHINPNPHIPTSPHTTTKINKCSHTGRVSHSNLIVTNQNLQSGGNRSSKPINFATMGLYGAWLSALCSLTDKRFLFWASSIPAERLFSHIGDIFTEKRSCPQYLRHSGYCGSKPATPPCTPLSPMDFYPLWAYISFTAPVPLTCVIGGRQAETPRLILLVPSWFQCAAC